MLDTITAPAIGGLQDPAAERPHPSPEQRGTVSFAWRLLTAMLDEVDYGMLLVTATARVLHANSKARRELDASHPLQLLGDQLRVRQPEDVVPLREAIDAAARRGLRRLLTMGRSEHAAGVAVVPLPSLDSDEPALTLVLVGKRQVCEELSVHGFARVHGLTPAETHVLQQLCDGSRPQEIALRQAVAISTVRTQISSIRGKTGAGSIRELVRQVAVLPPLVNVLQARSAPALQ